MTNLERADLARTDLARIDLGATDLARTDLPRTDLDRTDLARTYLDFADQKGHFVRGDPWKWQFSLVGFAPAKIGPYLRGFAPEMGFRNRMFFG